MLTPEQLKHLTGRSQAAAQARALTAMGIAYTLRPIDGKVVTTQEAVNAAILSHHHPNPPANGPKWSKTA